MKPPFSYPSPEEFQQWREEALGAEAVAAMDAAMDRQMRRLLDAFAAGADCVVLKHGDEVLGRIYADGRAYRREGR